MSTKTLQAFGIEVTNMGAVLNSLHQVTKATPLDLAQIASATKNSGASMRNFIETTSKSGKELEDYKPSIPTKIFDIEGRTISEYFIEKRKIIPFKDIPENFIKALIAVEDQSFYTHKGINFQGILRAFFVNIFSGYIKEGGSTLTQQLAKTLFTSRKRTYFRTIIIFRVRNGFFQFNQTYFPFVIQGNLNHIAQCLPPHNFI